MTRLAIENIQADGLGPITLEIAAAECVCLSGPSGSGKSRLLRAIADLDVHTGQAYLDKRPRNHFRPADWRRAVGLLPPESHWWLERVAAHFRDIDFTALAALGLDKRLLEQPVSQLSSGERQRLGLLRLLANNPRVLLLDEPTANLDPTNTRRVEGFLDRYRREQGTPILWVTHDEQQIRRVASRQLSMTGGKLADGVKTPP